MKIHTVLILAGGDGDRFYPLEQKVLFRFNGKTVLQHIVESVKDLTEQMVVVTSADNESAIKSDLSAYKVQYVVQTKDANGQADAVLAAKQYLTKDALIMNGNDQYDFSIIKRTISKTKEEGNDMGIIARYIESYFPGGYIRFQGEMVAEIVEKPIPEKRPSNYYNMSTHYFNNCLLFVQELERHSSSDDLYERAFSALLKKKYATCFKYDGGYATLKYSWHVLSMQDYFFAHHLTKSIDSSATIHKTATIEGDVFMGKNAKVGAYSKITGPCYIGDNVVVGDHSLIRNSTVEQDSLIGSGCEVARSYLAKGVMLHRNYVGDSVLSEGVSMGAGAVTANYRFDAQTVKTPIKGTLVDSQKGKFGLITGRDVKIGVNASTYPGVKLSAKTIILPGEVVKKDIL